MHVHAISLAQAPRHLPYRGNQVATGIYKSPVATPVRVTAQGFAGDLQVDRKNHGGPDKAVYAYTLENHHYWATTRGEPAYPPGQFGENLTVTGMPDERVHIGDIFRIGASLMQVTQPRVPCFKLGLKFGDPGFVREFLASGRTGFYLRVLEEGIVASGDPIMLQQADPQQVSIRDAMRALLTGSEQWAWREKVLAVPSLSAAWREDLAKRLPKDSH